MTQSVKLAIPWMAFLISNLLGCVSPERSLESAKDFVIDLDPDSVANEELLEFFFSNEFLEATCDVESEAALQLSRRSLEESARHQNAGSSSYLCHVVLVPRDSRTKRYFWFHKFTEFGMVDGEIFVVVWNSEGERVEAVRSISFLDGIDNHKLNTLRLEADDCSTDN